VMASAEKIREECLGCVGRSRTGPLLEMEMLTTEHLR
jgi:hypothetical protein